MTDLLHTPVEDGGLGFCHESLKLLPPGYHGPLIVSLDSNIIIDLREHGAPLLNGDQITGVDEGYVRDLEGLGEILELWLTRDIRFVVTPRSLTDARKRTERFLSSQAPAVQALAEALAFQQGNWSQPDPSTGPPRSLAGDEIGLPSGADRDLVLESQSIGSHIFLTRDKRVLKQVELTGPQLAVTSPAALAALFRGVGIGLLSGGTCESSACPYREWPLPFPDSGKWGPLLNLF